MERKEKGKCQQSQKPLQLKSHEFLNEDYFEMAPKRKASSSSLVAEKPKKQQVVQRVFAGFLRWCFPTICDFTYTRSTQECNTHISGESPAVKMRQRKNRGRYWHTQGNHKICKNRGNPKRVPPTLMWTEILFDYRICNVCCGENLGWRKAKQL